MPARTPESTAEFEIGPHSLPTQFGQGALKR